MTDHICAITDTDNGDTADADRIDETVEPADETDTETRDAAKSVTHDDFAEAHSPKSHTAHDDEETTVEYSED